MSTIKSYGHVRTGTRSCNKMWYVAYIGHLPYRSKFSLSGVTFPSGDMQRRLLRETYKEAGVRPADVAYVEAHGTGTQAGDSQEGNAICDVFCKDREKPLLIGSVKSNMGHCESPSGMSFKHLQGRSFGRNLAFVLIGGCS